MNLRRVASDNETTWPWPSIPPSLLVILFANALPLLGVVFAQWSVFVILALYWIENVAVGFVSFLKMLTCQGGDRGLAKFALAGFFAIHYGIFTLVHGIFVLALGGFSGKSFYGPADGPANWWLFGLAAACIGATHILSYAYDFMLHGEGREKSPDQIMWQPYPRMVVLHVSIILGAFATLALGAAWPVIAILVLLKTALDLVMTKFLGSW